MLFRKCRYSLISKHIKCSNYLCPCFFGQYNILNITVSCCSICSSRAARGSRGAIRRG